MKREIIETSDGSRTIRIPEWNENYHSGHGALQEAEHVFIEHGLSKIKNTGVIRVFEMGFGTGLNAILAYRWAQLSKIKIEYIGVEAFPVELELIDDLNYSSFLSENEKFIYKTMHELEWGRNHVIVDGLHFEKIVDRIENYSGIPNHFDIVFYDAFGPRINPVLWGTVVLKKMFDILKSNGVLATYCAQGQFKRNLKSVGFEVKSLPGPPGKREMTLAIKL